MFRPVVAIIRSLSFDTLKSALYNCVFGCLMRRSQHHGLFLSPIYLYCALLVEIKIIYKMRGTYTKLHLIALRNFRITT